MATNYDPTQPSMRDRVRFRVGDVSGNPQWFLQDEEIDALLSQYLYSDGSVNFDEICAVCAENIGAQCIQLAETVQQRNLKRVYGQRSAQAFALADRIRNLAQPGPGDPPNPGASVIPLDRPDLAVYDSLLGTSSGLTSTS